MNLKSKFVLPFAAGTLMLATGAIFAEDTQAPVLGDDTVAQVNGEDISNQQFLIFFQDRIKNQPNLPEEAQAQAQSAAFSELMKVFILAQDAEAKGLTQRADVQDALLVQKKQFLARMAMLDFLNGYTVDEEELQKRYQAAVDASPKMEYKARHILVQTEDDAKAVIVELDGGADFAELAKERSTGPSGPNGGDLGWFKSDQMVAPFADATAAMAPGSYSKEPVQTQFGWHVILLEETREPEAPSLDSLRPKLEQELKQEALRGYINGLVSGARIDVNEKFAKKQEAPTAAAEGEADAGK